MMVVTWRQIAGADATLSDLLATLSVAPNQSPALPSRQTALARPMYHIASRRADSRVVAQI